MYGSTNNTFGSSNRLWGETDTNAQPHHIISVFEEVSDIEDVPQRTPLGAAFGKVFDIARYFGRRFNPRINQ